MEAATSEAWAGLQSAMREAEALVSEAAPDAETRAEGLGYLARLVASTLESTFSPHERTTGGLYFGWMKLGGYNPDYLMGRAQIDPKGRYRLTGRLNDAVRLGIGFYSPTPRGQDLDAYTSNDHLDLDAEGRFALEIGPDLSGPNTLAQGPASSVLTTRELVLKPGGRRPEMTFTRLDVETPPLSAQPLTPDAADARLKAAAAGLLVTVRRFLTWSRVISSRPNEVTVLAEELDQAVRGDPDTRYYSGYFDLEPDQALVIELPQVECPYRAIQAVTHWLEPIPRANFNHTNWRADPDGVVRVVVARRDPGRANWLDVGGRRRGALLYRTVGLDREVIPQARVVALESP